MVRFEATFEDLVDVSLRSIKLSKRFIELANHYRNNHLRS